MKPMTNDQPQEAFVLTLTIKRVSRTPMMIKSDRLIRDVLAFTVSEDDIAKAIQKAMLLLEVERDTRGIGE